MGDGSIDITKWIERMVHKNGLTSFKVEFAHAHKRLEPEVSHDRAKERAEHTANPSLQATIPTTKETPRPSEWKDLDTLLFPEDKEG